MDVSPKGYGIVKIDQAAPPSYPYINTLQAGVQVELEAVPVSGYRFENWDGSLSGTSNPTAMVMDCNKSVIANFSLVMHTLELQISGNGSTTPPVGTHDYSSGMVISLTAIPESGWQFDGWTGNVADPSLAATTVIMDSDKIVTASFSQIAIVKANWPLVGGILGGLILVALLFVVAKRSAH